MVKMKLPMLRKAVRKAKDRIAVRAFPPNPPSSSSSSSSPAPSSAESINFSFGNFHGSRPSGQTRAPKG